MCLFVCAECVLCVCLVFVLCDVLCVRVLCVCGVWVVVRVCGMYV